MNEQQEYLLKLLLEIDDICTRNSIDYALSDGSLIGAVRHGGFLPWDDDADIKMTRPNWLRFQEVCKTKLPANRRLDVPTDPSYSNTLPRYTSLDTTAIHAYQCLDDSFEGLPIDIFVLEPIRRDPDVIRAYTHDLMLYSDLVNYSGVFGRRFGVKAEEYKRYRRLMDERGGAYVRELFEEKLASYLDEDGEVYIMRWGGNPIIYERAWFDSSTRVQFEGHSFQAPAGIDEYLSYHYGDEWYQVPYIDETPKHTMAESLYIPACDAEELCLAENRGELKRKIEERKVSMLANAPRGYELNDELLRSEGALIAEDALDRYRERADELSPEYHPEDAAVYEDIFARFISWQFSSRIAGRDDWNGVHRLNNPIVAELTEKPRHALLSYLFNSEQVGRSSRLLQMLEQTGHVLDAWEMNLRKAIDALRLARAKLQYGEIVESLRLLAGLRADAPFCKTVLKTELSAMLRQADGERGEPEGKTAPEGADLAGKACHWYPDDGDFSFYRERFARLQNSGRPVEGSGILLRHAVRHTRNGMILHELLNDEACDDEMHIQIQSVLAGGRGGEGKGPGVFDREVAERYCNLQQEVLRICGKLGLHAVLNPLQVRSMVSGEDRFTTNPSAYTLLLQARELQKLVHWLQKHPDCLPEDIGFECMATNPTYPDYSLRFYDDRTTNLSSQSSSNYRHSGMYLTIQSFKPVKMPWMVRKARSVWLRGCFVWGGENVLAGPTFRRMRQGRKLFKMAMDACSAPRSRQRVLVYNKAIDYQSSLFKDLRRVDMDGVYGFIPVDSESYVHPLDSIERKGGSFDTLHWFLSPRIAVSGEQKADCDRVRSEQSDRDRAQSNDIHTKAEFNEILPRQQEIIEEEDQQRRFIKSGVLDVIAKESGKRRQRGQDAEPGTGRKQ